MIFIKIFHGLILIIKRKGESRKELLPIDGQEKEHVGNQEQGRNDHEERKNFLVKG